MAGVLRYTMVVRHPESGVATALLEGEPAPGWASSLVQPDDLVSTKSEESATDSEPAKRPAAPTKKSAAKKAAASRSN